MKEFPDRIYNNIALPVPMLTCGRIMFMTAMACYSDKTFREDSIGPIPLWETLKIYETEDVSADAGSWLKITSFSTIFNLQRTSS